MRIPDFKVNHRTVENRLETLIRFQFTPPKDVIKRLRKRGFQYSHQGRFWTMPELVDEFRIRAIVENWSQD